MSFWFWFFPFLDFFFVRSSKIPSLLLVTFCWISSRKQLDDAFCRARRTTRGRRRLSSSEFLFCVLCVVRTPTAATDTFFVVWLCSFTHVLIFEREGKKRSGMGTRVMMMRRALSVGGTTTAEKTSSSTTTTTTTTTSASSMKRRRRGGRPVAMGVVSRNTTTRSRGRGFLARNRRRRL